MTAAPLRAQTSGVDLMYGRWWHSNPTEVYSATLYREFLGVFDYGLGVFHYDDSRSLDDRTQTGGQLSLSLGRDGKGLYLLGEAGLGVRHSDRNADAHWGAGAGYALRPLPFLSLGIEAQYRVEDRGAVGFWRLDPRDRRGLMLKGGILLGFTGSPRRGGAGRGGTRGGFKPPDESAIERAASGGGRDRDAARVAADVVKTALDVMGTPYRWGGTDSDGYDCSGLIQFAYGEHGIVLPRLSRDQARMGVLVDRKVDLLLPGDILGFAAQGSGVSHVALYVGDGLFIHSATGGVKLSSLTSDDPNSRWWRERWVVVRRIIN
ncbi:MAG: C40 family peptidase [Gemmatimonadales bacterium]